ncbi:MAG: hypothetical protein ACFFGP_16735 [Promethearchaeota archaeon]
MMAAILLYQLAVHPIVGLANNGDFERFMGRIGLKYAITEYSDKYFGYINRDFQIVERNWWRSGYVSSENLFMEVALSLSNLVSKVGVLDIRSLGLIHALAFLFTIWLMLAATRGFPRLVRYLFGFCAVLIFTDVGYVAYFNSLYSEPAALIFLCLAVGLIVLYLVSPKPRPFLLFCCPLAAMLFACSKPQNVWLGIPLAAYVVYLARKLRSRRWRTAILGAVVALCLGSGLVSQAEPGYQKGNNVHNSIFNGILLNSPAPEKDLRELGLDVELAKYAGTISYMPDSAVNDAGLPVSFFASLGWGRILEFYVSHPSRLVKLAQQGAHFAFYLRPPGHGNFEKSAGLPPGATSQAFDQWSVFRATCVPKSLWFLVGFLGVNLGTGVACLLLNRDPMPDAPASAGLVAALALTGMMAFASSIIGAGLTDIEKHLFTFNMLVDLLLTLDLLALGDSMYWKLSTICRIGRE